MPSVTSAAGPIYIGMETSKNTIAAGILLPGQEIPVIDRIWNDQASVRRLRLASPTSSGSTIGRCVPNCRRPVREGALGAAGPAIVVRLALPRGRAAQAEVTHEPLDGTAGHVVIILASLIRFRKVSGVPIPSFAATASIAAHSDG